MKFKINVSVGDFKPSSREMTSKGLLCRDAVLAIGDQIRNYHPTELNLPKGDGKMIRMFTPSDVLFSDAVINNINGADLVDNHPAGNIVTPDNWRKHSIGVASNVRRDGNKLIGDLLVKDANAIKAIQDNKRTALSLGYTLVADAIAGKSDDGKDYDIVVTDMVGDHVALVKTGRGGHEVRIGDEKSERNMRKIKLASGLTFEVEGENLDAFEQSIEAQNIELQALKEKADGEITIGEKTFKVSDTVAIQAAFDAITQQKVDAETKATELEANQIKPEDVEALAAKRSLTIEEAKALKPDLEPAGKSLDEIINETVLAHAGDSAVKAILAGIAIGDAKTDMVGMAFNVLVATKPSTKVNANAGDSAVAKALQNINAPATISAKDIINQAKSNMYKVGE